MKRTSAKKLLSLVLCAVMIAALALTGCGNSTPEETSIPTESTAVTESLAATDPSSSATQADVTVLGTGATTMKFMTADLDGKETHYEIHTDKKTVGEALLENKLVTGTVGEFGLMVESVNGLALDFNEDGMYWSFLINGEYAQTGVDATEIVEGTNYSLVPAMG